MDGFKRVYSLDPAKKKGGKLTPHSETLLWITIRIWKKFKEVNEKHLNFHGFARKERKWLRWAVRYCPSRAAGDQLDSGTVALNTFYTKPLKIGAQTIIMYYCCCCSFKAAKRWTSVFPAMDFGQT